MMALLLWLTSKTMIITIQSVPWSTVVPLANGTNPVKKKREMEIFAFGDDNEIPPLSCPRTTLTPCCDFSQWSTCYKSCSCKSSGQKCSSCTCAKRCTNKPLKISSVMGEIIWLFANAEQNMAPIESTPIPMDVDFATLREMMTDKQNNDLNPTKDWANLQNGGCPVIKGTGLDLQTQPKSILLEADHPTKRPDTAQSPLTQNDK